MIFPLSIVSLGLPRSTSEIRTNVSVRASTSRHDALLARRTLRLLVAEAEATKAEVSSGIVGSGEPFSPLSRKTNIRSRWKVNSPRRKRACSSSWRRDGWQNGSTTFTRPFRPSYFPRGPPPSPSHSLTHSFHSPSARSFVLAAFSAPVSPSKKLCPPPPLGVTQRRLKITVSSCVRYLDRENATPSCDSVPLVAWIYQN